MLPIVWTPPDTPMLSRRPNPAAGLIDGFLPGPPADWKPAEPQDPSYPGDILVQIPRETIERLLRDQLRRMAGGRDRFEYGLDSTIDLLGTAVPVSVRAEGDLTATASTWFDSTVLDLLIPLGTVRVGIAGQELRYDGLGLFVNVDVAQFAVDLHPGAPGRIDAVLVPRKSACRMKVQVGRIQEAFSLSDQLGKLAVYLFNMVNDWAKSAVEGLLKRPIHLASVDLASLLPQIRGVAGAVDAPLGAIAAAVLLGTTRPLDYLWADDVRPVLPRTVQLGLESRFYDANRWSLALRVRCGGKSTVSVRKPEKDSDLLAALSVSLLTQHVLAPPLHRLFGRIGAGYTPSMLTTGTDRLSLELAKALPLKDLEALAGDELFGAWLKKAMEDSGVDNILSMSPALTISKLLLDVHGRDLKFQVRLDLSADAGIAAAGAFVDVKVTLSVDPSDRGPHDAIAVKLTQFTLDFGFTSFDNRIFNVIYEKTTWWQKLLIVLGGVVLQYVIRKWSKEIGYGISVGHVALGIFSIAVYWYLEPIKWVAENGPGVVQGANAYLVLRQLSAASNADSTNLQGMLDILQPLFGDGSNVVPLKADMLKVYVDPGSIQQALAEFGVQCTSAVVDDAIRIFGKPVSA